MFGGIADAVTSPLRATGRLVFGDKKLKVGVVGAGGGIGQPLSLLLKLSPFVSELSLFDVADFTPGIFPYLHHTLFPALSATFLSRVTRVGRWVASAASMHIAASSLHRRTIS